MTKVTNQIAKYLPSPDRSIKIVCWTFFILWTAGYYLFQRPLILSAYAAYGVSDLTVLCLLLVLCLLPYSLSHRLKLDTAWYSLAFCPSMAILAIVSNEQVGWRTVILTAALLIVWLYLVIRRPRLHLKKINLNLWTLIAVAAVTYMAGNTDMLTHYRCRIQSHLANNDYQEALQIGIRTDEADTAVFNLRATAMIRTNQLADKMFTFPVPAKTSSIAANSKYSPDIMLCNLLLQKRLNDFVRLLPHYYDISSSTLPQHYKEALIIYMTRTANPQIAYSNTLIEANYVEFIAEKKRYSSPAESKYKCKDLYGNTYFWYYYFH